jgi:hypothetical protein
MPTLRHALLVLLVPACTSKPDATKAAPQRPSPAAQDSAEPSSASASEPEPGQRNEGCDPLPAEGDPCEGGLCPVNSDQYLECTEGTWHLITEFPDPGLDEVP